MAANFGGSSKSIHVCGAAALVHGRCSHACETFALLICPVAASSLSLAPMSPDRPRVRELRPLARLPDSPDRPTV